MTERWSSGLEELSRVPMSEGLLERAEEGPRMPDPGGPGGARRAVTIVVALGLFMGGAFGAWEVLRPSASITRLPAASTQVAQRVYGTVMCPVGLPKAQSGYTMSPTPDSDPVGWCRGEWHDPPAAFIACVPDDQPAAIAVVPASVSSDGKCAGVDAHYLDPLLRTSGSSFSPLPDGWDGNLAVWRATLNQALQAFPNGGFTVCPADPQAGVDAWTKALAENGFASWQVVNDADVNAQCTSFDVNYDDMTVRVHDASPPA